MSHANATIDLNQQSSTKLLRDRTHSVFRLQAALERAIKGQMEEFSNLSEQRSRLLNALIVLKMPESIGNFSVLFEFVFILTRLLLSVQLVNALHVELDDLKAK